MTALKAQVGPFDEQAFHDAMDPLRQVVPLIGGYIPTWLSNDKPKPKQEVIDDMRVIIELVSKGITALEKLAIHGPKPKRQA